MMSLRDCPVAVRGSQVGVWADEDRSRYFRKRTKDVAKPWWERSWPVEETESVLTKGLARRAEL